MNEPDSKAPDSKAYGDSWYAATMVDAPPRPRLSFDLDVDVCVVGGGLAGLTTAREVARRGWSVVLLEAGRLAQSASGRNTGFVLPGFGADADKLVARVGFERTKDLWSLAQAGLDYVRADRIPTSPAASMRRRLALCFQEDNSDEFLDMSRCLANLAARSRDGRPSACVRCCVANGISTLSIICARLPFTRSTTRWRSRRRRNATARAFSRHTPALSIDPTGVRKRIVTPGARLRANHVVLCGNVELGLMPRLATTLVPMTTYVITTAPLGEELAEAVGYPRRDQRLRSCRQSLPHRRRRSLDAVGSRDSLGRGTCAIMSGRLTGDIKKTYPQLGDVTAEYSWNGTLGLTVHLMPQIGELGPGVWLASGFGGHGLNTTAMAGNLIARAIVEGDQTWRQFTPFELVWAGGVFGRGAAQARSWIKRLRDRYEERRAKARELMHRRHMDAEAARAGGQAAAEQPIEQTVEPEPVQPGTVVTPASAPAEMELVGEEAVAFVPATHPLPGQAEEPAPQIAPMVDAGVPADRPKRKKRRPSASRKTERGTNHHVKS